ncbi:SGNH/GDSL hydrolase family protein [Brevibacterium litoralis]|uniref:SGNH/GDSL hydrolase family protein n=1 Tax=Brevibacterium litoralis TaxID=3138935 RepID=UPI0032EB5F01
MTRHPLLTTAVLGTIGGLLAAGGGYYAASLRTVRGQSAAHPEFWRERRVGQAAGDTATGADGLHPGALDYVVLGDSAAAGVGVKDPELGYVRHVEDDVSESTGHAVRTTNLAVPGARTRHLLDDQMPLFDRVCTDLRGRTGHGPDLVTCVIGGNDMIDPRFDPVVFEDTLEELFARLPRYSVVSTIPSFAVPPFETRVKAANTVVLRQAEKHDMVLADLYGPYRKLWPVKYFRHCAGDFFHPNARGYEVWGEAIGQAAVRSLELRAGGTFGCGPDGTDTAPTHAAEAPATSRPTVPPVTSPLASAA